MTGTHPFHAHIYFDPPELARVQALAHKARERFGAAVGHFHEQPVGPHPRGSCQLTVAADRFGDFAAWAATGRDGLTIFAHADTGEDWRDHTENVVWFGASEKLNYEIFVKMGLAPADYAAR
jgi:DOPA 4,5-dioxygenase